MQEAIKKILSLNIRRSDLKSQLNSLKICESNLRTVLDSFTVYNAKPGKLSIESSDTFEFIESLLSGEQMKKDLDVVDVDILEVLHEYIESREQSLAIKNRLNEPDNTCDLLLLKTMRDNLYKSLES